MLVNIPLNSLACFMMEKTPHETKMIAATCVNCYLGASPSEAALLKQSLRVP